MTSKREFVEKLAMSKNSTADRHANDRTRTKPAEDRGNDSEPRQKHWKDVRDDKDCRIRLKSNAKGDPRHYVKTNVGTLPGLPQDDEVDPNAIWWSAERCYFPSFRSCGGSSTSWPNGPAVGIRLTKSTSSCTGCGRNESLGLSDGEIKKANQRLRKLVSRLERKV